MATARNSCGLLLAAHGEGGARADNMGVAQLADALSARNLVAEVRYGFIKGKPAIADAICGFSAHEIIVYPLFFAEGYFTRQRLPGILHDASAADSRLVFHVLPPLGVDPALSTLIVEQAVAMAQVHSVPCEQATVVLLAHGSHTDQASRMSAEELASLVRQTRRFRSARIALLEGEPALRDATADVPGPIIVVGLFAGEGRHGADDAPRLIAELKRHDIVFAGTVGAAGLGALVAAAVERQLSAAASRTAAQETIAAAL
jgi:sirohydrochlorin ferrochelatase